MKINFRKSSVMWFIASSRSTGVSYPPISIDGVELRNSDREAEVLGAYF